MFFRVARCVHFRIFLSLNIHHLSFLFCKILLLESFVDLGIATRADFIISIETKFLRNIEHIVKHGDTRLENSHVGS